MAALERTNLWRHFSAGSGSTLPGPQKPIEASDILDATIASLPQMSTGQSQLFAVARAILQLHSLHDSDKNQPNEPYHDNGAAISRKRSMPILLLDEATSSLDPESEAAIRAIIHEEFTDKGHTVIAITHRLSGRERVDASDPGRDVIMLLSGGKVEKFGPVEDVLNTQRTPFGNN